MINLSALINDYCEKLYRDGVDRNRVDLIRSSVMDFISVSGLAKKVRDLNIEIKCCIFTLAILSNGTRIWGKTYYENAFVLYRDGGPNVEHEDGKKVKFPSDAPIAAKYKDMFKRKV